VRRGQSRQITDKDYQAMKLNDNVISPDGFEVENGSGYGFLFFGSGGNYSEHYLTGHGASFKIQVNYSTSDYNNMFRFLGWVK
jgi:hypothetical protein